MSMTLNGIFSKPKSCRTNFIQENKRKLKEISSMVNHTSRSKLDMTKSKSSQTEITRTRSGSSTTFKENKYTPCSRCKLNNKGLMTGYMHEKREKDSISNISLSSKRKSSHKAISTKSQYSQTIDPRRCDQLFHDGIIKYPSNKVLQELAEIEKQKANRLDIHVKKEFFKRNRVKQKSPQFNKFSVANRSIKISEKGDEGGDLQLSENDDEEEDENGRQEEQKQESEIEETKLEPLTSENLTRFKETPLLTMCAAEIIRQTTENLNSPRKQYQSNHIPSSKGDSKSVKKIQKLTREEAVLKSVLDPHCPPGHIPLPDVERKKTLHMLRVSHAELVKEMNLLPVRTDTLRIRQKKIQLESQLNKIEEGIKVFNKSRVYVKIEE